MALSVRTGCYRERTSPFAIRGLNSSPLRSTAPRPSLPLKRKMPPGFTVFIFQISTLDKDTLLFKVLDGERKCIASGESVMRKSAQTKMIEAITAQRRPQRDSRTRLAKPPDEMLDHPPPAPTGGDAQVKHSTTTPPARPGQMLRAFRIARGLDQVQLAETLGCTQQMVDLLEKDRRPLQPHHAFALAEAFDLHLTLVEGRGMPLPELTLAASVVSDRLGRQMIEAFLHLEHADRYRIVSLTERLARDSRSAPPH